jgi:hypothetical protein
MNLLRTIGLVILLGLVSSGQAVAQDPIAGRLSGRWSTHPRSSALIQRPHSGTLRVNLKPNGDGTYQGTFAGRFAVVMPYFYRAKVVDQGGYLTASKRLGPMGEYRMQLYPNANGWQGNWTAGKSSGSIVLESAGRRSR